MTTTPYEFAAGREPFAYAGPPLILPASAFAALFIGSLVAGGILTGGAPYPIPFGATDASLKYFAEHANAICVVAFLQFAAAIPLGVFTASVTNRLRSAGIHAAGVTIALYGGFSASFFLAVSALVQWVLAMPLVAGVAANARVLQLVVFATGGPGHVVPLGLLVAGVSVVGGLARQLARPLMYFGLGVAIVAELSTFTLLSEHAAVLLPLARFPAIVWLLWVAAVLRRPTRSH